MPTDSDRSRYDQLPIPSYEEAISSRPASSQARLGPEEISDDAERQGLLQINSNYEPPRVESVRGSLDSLDGLEPEGEAEVRREMQQMEIEDPGSDSSSSRSLRRYRFKGFSFTNSFHSLVLPSFRDWLPSLPRFRIPYDQIDANRAIIIGRLFGIFLIMGILYVLIASDVLSFSRNRLTMGQMFDPESIRVYMQNHMNRKGNMQAYLQHITEFPHIAGSEGNYVLGEWVAELYKAAELEEVTMERFDVYLNYPRRDGRRLAIVKPEDLAWEAIIEEEREETFVFHGHSKSGDVTGPLIYANSGSREDFKTLEEKGISVKGAVVLMKYFGSQGDRALKVKAAELAGVVGAVLYSDPAQEGYLNGRKFPEGRFMPEDGVQRGAVSLMSWVTGDVLSPGWASTPGNRSRIKPEDSLGLNHIPSLPIAWRDAKHLLESLKGHGKKIDGDWQGDPQLEYWTGNSDSPVVNLKNLQDEEVYQPIYNVLGKLVGWEQPEKRIIVGNHRDAWCTGAADPGSGTAVMLEVMRIFGELRRMGWRPLRTIEFASWDGEEYNLIGSTEHVENRINELRRDGMAYLNVDVGVTGTDFHAAASPIFHRTLMEAIGRVTDPSVQEKSVKDLWEESGRSLEGLGAGSDYVAFQDLAGTSSIDFFFKGQSFPYHSCYDNFEWMERFGDPDWNYHKALGEIWALMIFELADKPIAPFDLEAYARAVKQWINDLEKYSQDADHNFSDLDLSPLHDASDTLDAEARTFHEFDQHWTAHIYGRGGFEGPSLTMQRLEHNDRMTNFESDLLDLSEGGGLANRTQFKHVIFAPQKWSGYDEAFFPGIRDAIDDGDLEETKRQVEKVARIVSEAAKNLNRERGDG
jgi:Transferrin receptor-like dimerisation domain/Peptidase family M28/PA domain